MKTAATQIQNLRLKVAVNAFKKALLEDLHIPARAQTTAVFEVLSTLPEELLVNERTWGSWFSESPVALKAGSVSKLDALARHAGISFCDAEPRFLEKLISGGLAGEMAGTGTGRDPRLTLLMRAEKYRPASSLHLHLDAIELGVAADKIQGLGWEEVLATGARRILTLLHERWCPSSGTIYPTFPSPVREAWDTANASGRKAIEDSYSRWGPALLEHDLNACVQPAWRDLNVDMDIPPQHACRLLLGLVPDADFLQGERLKAWALDLATAGLALHALAWSDHYNKMGAKITIEHVLWAAIANVFFSRDELSEDDPEIAGAMEHCDGEYHSFYVQTLLQGRMEYQSQMADLGIVVEDVMQEAMKIRRIHPLTFS